MYKINKRIKKNVKYRQKFMKYELLKQFLRSIASNKYITDALLREKALVLLTTFPKNSSISYLKNYCILSFNSRSVYRKFRLSRWELKKQALANNLPNVSKNS